MSIFRSLGDSCYNDFPNFLVLGKKLGRSWLTNFFSIKAPISFITNSLYLLNISLANFRSIDTGTAPNHRCP